MVNDSKWQDTISRMTSAIDVSCQRHSQEVITDKSICALIFDNDLPIQLLRIDRSNTGLMQCHLHLSKQRFQDMCNACSTSYGETVDICSSDENALSAQRQRFHNVHTRADAGNLITNGVHNCRQCIKRTWNAALLTATVTGH